MYVVLTPAGPGPAAGSLLLQVTDDAGAPSAAPAVVVPSLLAAVVGDYEDRRQNIRWVFSSTREVYPQLLAAGVRVERSHDLALVRGILRFSEAAAPTPYIEALRTEAPAGDAELLPRQLLPVQPAPNQTSLFEELEGFDDPARRRGPTLEDQVTELAAQLAAVAGSASRQRLALLLAAESAGGLIAVEMEHAGLPWRRDVHEAMLAHELGPRPPEGQRPLRLERLAAELREKLGNPGFNPDSPQELLRALHRAGIEVKTTRSWELQQHEHPAIAPLLEYKRLSRLLTANGWTWLDAWVADGRFRPEYVVGGVVSGRWASRGGGALQIPKYVRDAVRPDPGHKLIVADAAQLEPRVLAALGQDNALAAAARGKDLYQGIADQNFDGDRSLAKMAMLGAMYGATSGEAGRLMPALTRSYPQAIDVVERGARAGESGKVVSSHLGRSSPPVSERWLRAQQSASAEEQRRADSLARSQGRFTRNFVVQSTAAEWALCWLAEIRRRLRAASVASPAGELVFFLHDEVMLHVPQARAEEVSALVTEAAAAATGLLFGRIPLEFPVVAVTIDSYADAK
ncbi:bifunctional 3'-5' exonuclease/DNA polymerase [Arthrobacter jiangjiafuii]|uniref:DNA-directed DNA polymerase n=1 Tax=Arthrobacter jiangjiafuii TaxID=2817475 RepID=A0A975M4G7_9MICC|nr:bifunctional 3'-5' exonuclease/DNA polymerase [Arthrobacter jiangjiafuii]MBP3042541.1 bifunctional 3'-5' exonuclease/DNA polymerase [Arthrobacter jiangjiafuii]QWC09720.1 bifunctional 3'-5' exonuclease/DNA polymerase [Arthrobacter jiangjiafuii]